MPTGAAPILFALTGGALAFAIAQYHAVARVSPPIAAQWRSALLSRTPSTTLSLLVAIVIAAVAFFLATR